MRQIAAYLYLPTVLWYIVVQNPPPLNPGNGTAFSQGVMELLITLLQQHGSRFVAKTPIKIMFYMQIDPRRFQVLIFTCETPKLSKTNNRPMIPFYMQMDIFLGQTYNSKPIYLWTTTTGSNLFGWHFGASAAFWCEK
jgi:hypothetical protein